MFSRTTSPRAADGRNMVATALLLAGVLFAPPAVHSQPLSGDGYLFHRPTGSLSVRGGYTQPNGNSDLFAFTREQLTLGRGDFGSVSFGGDLGFHVADRVSLQFNVNYSSRTAGSEMRAWLDNNGLPIEQSTQLTRLPFMMGVRYDLTNPGRRIGRLAYIPSRITPYVTAGGGAMWYRFKQVGSFVDFNTRDVFDTELETSGTTAAGYGAIGADFTLRPTLALTTEARYDFAHAPISSSAYSSFSKIDLSGISATIGLTFRY